MEKDTKLSTAVQKLMYKVMKMAVKVENGFIFFRYRTIFMVEFDQEVCEEMLKKMIINKDNVIRYLRKKYIPTWVEGGALFRNQSCIQKAKMKDGYMIIHIHKSEPHKIITDTIHVINLFQEQGFEVPLKFKFYIDQVQIAFQDTLLYNLLLKEFGYPVPYASRIYEKQLLLKYKRLDNVAKIKKRSVKRKFLRWRVKRGELEWTELRRIINITDFSPKNIKVVCDEIRDAARARGVEVDF